MKIFRNLYQYRELLKTNIKKEIRGKYKGSFLGVLWSFVSPLLSVLVYAIVFPYILRSSEEHYVVFLIIGIIPWTFFTTVINQGTKTVLGNSNLIKKVYFPREILPISVVTSGLINFIISTIIILLFLLFSGIGFSWYIAFFPLVVLIQYIISLAFVFILSAINVYVRDIEYIVNFFVMMLFYGTPILYSPTLFPDKLKWLFDLNPLSHIIIGYRDIFYYKQMPNLVNLSILMIIGLLLVFIGYRIFRKLERGFAEEV